MRLLIADRDSTERTGIMWLIRSSRLNFSHLDEVKDVDTLIDTIEQTQPDILYVELEMIPTSQWDTFVRTVQRYVKLTIAVTAEAVFERAMQAIELGVRTLLVKPFPPEQLRRSLFRYFKRLSFENRSHDPVAQERKGPPFTHSDLFLPKTKPSAVDVLYFVPEKDAQLHDLCDWLSEHPFDPNTVILPLSTGTIVLFPDSAEDRITLQTEGQRLLQAWEERGQGRLTIAIHHGLTNDSLTIHDAYQLTIQTMALRFYRGHHQLLWTHELPEYVQLDPFLTPDELREWKEMLDEGDKGTIKAWMYHHFTNFPHGFPDPDILRIRLTSVLAQLRRYMQTFHLDRQVKLESYYHDIFQTILYEPILFRIVQEILLFIYALIDAVEVQKELAIGDFIERGLQYVEQHYAKPTLSLDEVAHFVGRSPNYFSQTLSRKKGQTFRQYLTDIRIQHAKKLLRNRSSTVREVARAVGFTDANYFSRVFKKKTGFSPNAWRHME